MLREQPFFMIFLVLGMMDVRHENIHKCGCDSSCLNDIIKSRLREASF